MNSNNQKINRLKLSNYELLRTIGKGSFGKVKLAKEKLTNRYLAIKILEKTSII